MLLKRLALAGLVAGVGLATAGCTDGYGYSGLSVGYGTAGYGYDGYGYDGGYGGVYGYGYPSYSGWYSNYYYPGTGVYVYDQYRRPYRWNNDQQRYWQNRRGTYRGDRDGIRDNWGAFTRRNARPDDGDRGYRGGEDHRGGERYRGGERERDGQNYRGDQHRRDGQNDGDRRGYREGRPGGGYGNRGQAYPRSWTGPAVVPNTFGQNPSGDASGIGHRGQGGDTNASPAHQGDRGGEGRRHGRR